MRNLWRNTVMCLLVAAIFVMPISAIKNGDREYQTLNHDKTNRNDITGTMQPPEIEWELTYGGANYELLYCVQQTNDGGYIAAGYWEDSTKIEYSWVIKVDKNGLIEWDIANPGEEDEYYNWVIYIQQTNDGGYIAAGEKGPSYYRGDGFLWKINPNGSTEWYYEYPFGQSQYGGLYCVQQTSDNGFIAVGYTQGIESDYYDYHALLLKTDSTGAVEWRKQFYNGGRENEFISIRVTSDGGYIIGGSTMIDNDPNFWMIKTDMNGEMEWEKILGGDSQEYLVSKNCLSTEEDGYLFSGITNSYGAGKNDIWVVKTDGQGDVVWDETFGEKTNDVCMDMDVSTDGGFIFCGSVNAEGLSGSKSDLWVIKTDDEGNVQWSKKIGGNEEDFGYSVSKTVDGGYILAGQTKSFGSGDSDGWLIKLAPDTFIVRPSITLLKPKSGWIYFFDFFGFPFPIFQNAVIFGDITFKVVTICGAEGTIVTKVEYFLDGKVIGEVTEPPFSYTWEGEESGIYNFKIRSYNSFGGTDKETVTAQKIV